MRVPVQRSVIASVGYILEQPKAPARCCRQFAGSMITAASVTFSLTSVALSLAAQQFGSRVLRNFMRDRITQVVLGTFIASFVYCLLVERAVRGTDAAEVFVPHLSIRLGVVFALLSLILAHLFVHHVSSSIQAATIVDGIGSKLESSINRLNPAKIGSAVPRGERRDEMLQNGSPVLAVFQRLPEEH